MLQLHLCVGWSGRGVRSLTVVPYDGCGHACVYCYVPLARHITREQFDAGAKARKNLFSLAA